MSTLDDLLLQAAGARNLVTPNDPVAIDNADAAAGRILVAQSATRADWQAIPAASKLIGIDVDATSPAAGEILTALSASSIGWRLLLPTKMQVYFSGSPTFTYSSAGTWVDMPFDTVDQDIDGSFDAASGGFKAKQSGYYIVGMRARFTNNPTYDSTGMQVAVRIGENRQALSVHISDGAPRHQAIGGAGMIYAETNDVVTTQIYLDDAPHTLDFYGWGDTFMHVLGPF